MTVRCYNFAGYAIGGNAIYEGFGLEKMLDGYEWYYTERAQRTRVACFAAEQEGVAYAHQQIAADRWATAHYVGLTAEPAEAHELARRIRGLGVAFWQDELAGFYAPGRHAYARSWRAATSSRLLF